MADITLRGLQQLPLSVWLRRWAGGDRKAADNLMAALGPYFLRAAKNLLRTSQLQSVMTPEELVHEAWVRLSNGEKPVFRNRRHFFGSMVRAMHFELIDRYRASQRPTPPEPPMIEHDDADPGRDEGDKRDAIRKAMAQLELEFPEHAGALLMHKLAGMTLEEIAALTEVSVITVRRRIDFGKAWVKRFLLDS